MQRPFSMTGISGGISPATSNVMRKEGGRALVHILHIGKTGGSTLARIFKQKQAEIKASSVKLQHHSHGGSIEQHLKDQTGQVLFFVRHPVSRFVSAFNSRLRMGRPARDIPWTPVETIAFRMFKEPEALASALDSEDEKLRALAELSMLSINHVRFPIKKWTGGPKALERRRGDIFFIGAQETFDDDCRALLRKMGVSDTLPEFDDVQKHVAPAGLSKNLSDRSVANLKKWYERDIEIYDWCMKNRDSINKAGV